MKMVVVAVPGSGKTTILKYVKEMMPEVVIVNYGDVMLQLARELHGITNRDEMRKVLSVEEYRKVQELAADRIAAMQGDVIIDTHASIKMHGGYYPGLPDRVVARLRPDIILVLEFDVERILERREKDRERARDVESREEIEMHQMANRYYAFAAANAGECTVYILNMRGIPETRPYEHAEIAAKRIVELFKKVKER